MSTDGNSYLIDLSPEDYNMAFTEIAFLMDAFASTIDNIMGGATAPVGRIAGRDTAKKLPVNIADPTLENVVALLSERMHAGFDFSLEQGNLTFRKCVIRDICQLRQIETNGAICRLFHAYLDGIIDGLLSRPVKSEIVATGEECLIKTVVQ